MLAISLAWFETAIARLQSFPGCTSGDRVTAVTGQLVKTGYYSSVSHTVKLKRRNELALLYLKRCKRWLPVGMKTFQVDEAVH